jgi:hypothetical protein
METDTQEQQNSALYSVDFEIFGRVQGLSSSLLLQQSVSRSSFNKKNLLGVFFRKCTRDHGSKLGLRGWCRNTESGTVQGTMEGDRQQINLM